jgi:cysteine dioxygenase
MNTLLKSFVDRLESLQDKPPLPMQKRCLLEMNGRHLPIEEYVSFSDQGYKRNIIHVSDKCEVTVLCFKEGQRTPIHDHADSLGITIIREGIMTEELFDKQSAGTIVPAFTRKFHTSELSYINVTTIHRVSNVHTGELIMMNVYFPPLTSMNIYHIKDACVEKWVADYSR